MLKRDIAIIIVSFVALFFSLQHDGTISFRKAWHHELSWDSRFHHGHPQLVPPVVADLNGDGRLELIAATYDYKLEVVRPRPAGRGGEGFAAAEKIAEVSLLPNKVTVPAGRKLAALAVGYIDVESDEKVRVLRKQVVVAVTESWHVMCFDHNLRLLWEHTMPVHMPRHGHMAEVGIFISPHKVHLHDRGMVIVGGSVETGPLLSADEVGRGESDVDVLNLEAEYEQQVSEHEHSAGRLHHLEDVDEGDLAAGVDTRRHFSYFAFEGFTGAERWRHDNSSFHKDLQELADETHPQNNYRLDAEKLNARHFGEASCRDYRESVLHVLPHLWTDRWDTRLEAAHFVQHKVGKGAQKHTLADKKQDGPSKQIAGVGRSTPLAKLLKHSPPAPLHHTPLHHHHRRKNTTQANAIVAYLQEGIEVIHLYTGRTICQLHLPDSILHADINGDGVVEHIYTQHEFQEEPESLTLDGLHRLGACRAVVRAGIPPSEHVADLVFCDPNTVHRDLVLVALGHVEENEFEGQDLDVEVAPPAFLPLPRLSGEYGPKARQHGLMVFMVNHGEITAFDHYGTEVWQVNLGTHWNNPHAEVWVESEPTLQALALQPHAVPSAILAAGENRAVVVSEHGNLLDELDLPHPPTHPIMVDDFSGDGLNDLIVVTAQGYYGYVQGHHVGTLPLSTLVCVLLVAMGVVYYSSPREKGQKGRHGRVSL